MYEMENYNGPDDYDGYLHDFEKEIVVETEEDVIEYLDRISRDQINLLTMGG